MALAQAKTRRGKAGKRKAAETNPALERYLRAVNYLAAAQVYLKDNPLLREPLKADHIKDRLLGHWGTCPGINLVYLHLNQLILRTGAGLMLVTGPGHGAAANLANMYMEGTLAEYYPELGHGYQGLYRFVRRFSWPDGFPSHLNPALPGVIHEGGELGYALATSFGAVLDNPHLVVACLVGDGEAETGPTATAWHGIKFLNPARDGAVLPILHLNGYKISSPTVFGTMPDEELNALFSGYGYDMKIVALSDRIHAELAGAFDWALARVHKLQSQSWVGNAPMEPRWPMIILKTPKGWTGPKQVDGKPVEGSFRSHQVPAKEAKTNPAHLKIVEKWLRSYRPEELFDEHGRPAADILALCPRGESRMAQNPHSFGGRMRKELMLPPLEKHAVPIGDRGAGKASSMEVLGQYLKEVIVRNKAERNFRIVCPDELESNRLQAVFEVTCRQYAWPVPANAEFMGSDGRVLEMLSEHNCQGWLQGYLLTGRHGLFPCYEAFLPIVDGMMNQYAKFLKSSLEVPWRRPISSLNYLLTSEAWRQDHNGYSHQGPGFINNLLTKKGHTYRIYLPPDANCVLCTLEHCLTVTNSINLVIASKQPAPQWLSLEEAREHCRVGASVWRWASTNDGEDPEVVLCGCGDNPTTEVLAAAQILREEAPEFRVRVVNVTDLLVVGVPEKYPHGLTEDRFQRLFPLGCPVVFNFHGYTAAIKQMVFERPEDERFEINGYREEGTTTTPFDMLVRNQVSRYHLVIQAARQIAGRNRSAAAKCEDLVVKYERRLLDHHTYIRENDVDPPEIANWEWR